MKCVDIIGKDGKVVPIDYIITRIDKCKRIPDDTRTYCIALLKILRKYTNSISPGDLNRIIHLASFIDSLDGNIVMTNTKLATVPKNSEPN